MTYIVLQRGVSDEEGRPDPDRWEFVGTVGAANRVQAWEDVKAGKLDGRGVRLAPGESTSVRLVPASAWGTSFPVRARQVVELEGGPA